MRHLYFFALFLLCCSGSTIARQKPSLTLSKEFIDKQLAQASAQVKYLIPHVPEDKFPRTFENGAYKFSASSWWCSGFYPGTLLYLYEGTGDKQLLSTALSKLKELEQEQFNTRTHDLGFMLFCSFGNALRLTGDSASYKNILATGAKSLATRYSPVTKTIRSWDHKPWQYPVIVDNMMNLEFLTQLSKITGVPTYYDIAVTHANTTMKNHFRKDYSSYHVVDYDAKMGKVIAKKTHQGGFDASDWSRGQGWALYGYTMMFRETKNKKYLAQAKHIADFILKHPNMPTDLIPYWDFDKDQIASTDKMYRNRDLRDVSAGAIYASALLELAQYVSNKDAATYMHAAETMLQNLSKPPYLSTLGSTGGFILDHSVGSLPGNSEIDVPLSYADYYYVEALIRYQRLLAGKSVISTI